MSSDNLRSSTSTIQTPIRNQKLAVVRNLLVISVSVMLLFTASQSVDKLQSSIHFEEHLGTTVLSIVNVFNMIGSFFISAYLTKLFGPKLVLVLSMVGFVFYIVANFYANWYTMIPAAVLMGTACATLYTALWTYIGALGAEYSNLTGHTTEVVYAWFYAFFFMFIQSASIWGNAISYKVLNSGSEEVMWNVSAEQCGANFCDNNINETSRLSSSGTPSNFYLLCGIFTAVGIVAIVCACFLDRQPPQGTKGQSVLQGVLESARVLVRPAMLLVFPITFYGGLQLSFITGDYTKAYITCAFGVANVGYIFICYGVVSTLFSPVVGHLVKIIGRRAVFLLSTIIDIAVYLTLALYHFRGWQPVTIHFVLIGLIGITTTVWQAQVKALYGILFADCQEVAFALLGVNEPLGIAIGFFYSGYLCTLTKIYVLGGFLVLGMLGYAAVEARFLRRTSISSNDQ